MVVYNHAFADLVAGNPLARSDNRARHLVAEDPGSRMRPGVNLLQVGSAYPAGGDLYQQLARTYAGYRYSFDTHIIHAAVHHRAHGRGNSGFDQAFSV